MQMKIRLTFLGIAVLFVVFSLFALNRMALLNQKSTEMETNWLPSIIKVNAINTATSDYRLAEALHILTTVPEEMEQQEREMSRIAQDIVNWRKEYEPLISAEQEREVYQDFSRKYEEYLQSSKVAVEHSRKNENDQAAVQLKKSGILFNAFSNDLLKLVKLNEEGGVAASQGGDQLFIETQAILITSDVLVAIAIFILMLLVEVWSSQSDTRVTVFQDDEKRGQANFFSKLTIKAKLRGAFLGLAILFMIFAWFALNRMGLVNDKSTEIELNWLPSVVAVNAINTATSDLRSSEALHVISTDPTDMLEQEKITQGLKADIAQQRNKYEPLISSTEEQGIYQNFTKKYDDYLAASDKALALSRKNQNEQAGKQLKQSGTIFNDMSADLLKLVDLNSEGANTASREGDRLHELSITILTGVSACVFILAILLMILFEKAVSRPLGRLTAAIQQLANGNVQVTHEYHDRYDEIGYIAQAVKTITQTLDILIKDSSELIGAAQAGALSSRVESSRHPGEFGVIIAGMNKLLEVLSKPLAEVAEVMQQLALGNLKRRIEGAYEGDLRALKANVNRSLDALVGLLTELGDITQNMAIGDLSQVVKGNYQGDFSALKANVNQALQQMKEILTTVVVNTEHIATASTQTTSAANHVSEQSSKQLSSLEEVASAVTETSAAIGQIADNTKRGGELAISTAELAATGRGQLIKLSEIIEQIAGEYKCIEQITSKINRIADKTHLLSLNAGLEAVRAGEHGLGFGFVAQQIGKLAEEASLSAREIGSLIANSSQSVNLSVNTAQQTRTAIENIAKAAQDSGQAVEAISVAITQQSMAIDWISEQVNKMQGSGQENAAAAEEISTTMLRLADAIKETHTQVQRFKLA